MEMVRRFGALPSKDRAMKNIQERLVDWFSDQEDISGYDQDALLGLDYFEAELIDSFGIMTLVMHVEKTFEVTLTEDHFQDRRFTSIQGLSEIIKEIQDVL